MNKKNKTREYWNNRYLVGKTGWDLGLPSPPLTHYIDQLVHKEKTILVPGAGNAYEVEYLIDKGFTNAYVLDISEHPLKDLKERTDLENQYILNEDFFEHSGQYDLIFEQTFFCSFPPTVLNREGYAKQMSSLLKPGGKLVGLWFDIPLTDDMEKRPFGGSREEYLKYFLPYFSVKTFEPCYNSIMPRSGNELFGIFEKK